MPNIITTIYIQIVSLTWIYKMGPLHWDQRCPTIQYGIGVCVCVLEWKEMKKPAVYFHIHSHTKSFLHCLPNHKAFVCWAHSLGTAQGGLNEIIINWCLLSVNINAYAKGIMYQFIKMDQHLNWHRFACMCAGVFFQAYLSKNSFIHCLFVKVGIYFGNPKCFDCSFLGFWAEIW